MTELSVCVLCLSCTDGMRTAGFLFPAVSFSKSSSFFRVIPSKSYLYAVNDPFCIGLMEGVKHIGSNCKSFLK